MRYLILFCLSCCLLPASSQSYRGLAVLSDDVIWMSGSKGYVLRSLNGGSSWDTLNPPGFQRKDFRDIHAWDASTAVVMSAGDSAVVLRTADGGKTWSKVYEDNRQGVFLDAMDFSGAKGVIIGDPYELSAGGQQYFDLVTTGDSGKTWTKSNPGSSSHLLAMKGQALFAASGTNIICHKDGSYEFVTGSGTHSSLVSSKAPHPSVIPLQCGATSGVYSFYRNNKTAVAAGGNYSKPDYGDSTAAFYNRKTRTWEKAITQPRGYRSCVSGNGKNLLVCTGTNGTDFSKDRGSNWKATGIKGYNVCAFSKNYLWLAGDKGRWEKVKVEDIN